MSWYHSAGMRRRCARPSFRAMRRRSRRPAPSWQMRPSRAPESPARAIACGRHRSQSAASARRRGLAAQRQRRRAAMWRRAPRGSGSRHASPDRESARTIPPPPVSPASHALGVERIYRPRAQAGAQAHASRIPLPVPPARHAGHRETRGSRRYRRSREFRLALGAERRMRLAEVRVLHEPRLHLGLVGERGFEIE